MLKASRCSTSPLRDRLDTGRQIAVVLVLGSIFVVYLLFSCFVPYIGDDYAFILDWMNANDGDRAFSFNGWLNAVEYLRATDNSRLDNIVYIAMRLAFPKSVLAVFVAFTATLMLWMMTVLLRPEKSVTLSVLIALWTWVVFTFPWRGDIMGTNYAYNIFLPSFLTLCFLILSFGVSYKRFSAPGLAAACLVALSAGWIHEGYSIPVCCGLGVLCLVRRFRLPWQWWVLAMVYVAGAIYTVSAPGLWMRFLDSSGETGGYVNIKTFFSMIIPVVSVAVLIAVMFSCGSGRRYLAELFVDDIFLVVFVSFAVSFLIVIVTKTFDNARALWICDIFSTIVVFKALAPLFVALSKRLLSVFSIFALTLTLIFYINVLRVQKIYHDEEMLIRDGFRESVYGTVYRDYDISIPKITLLHPINDYWRDIHHNIMYDKIEGEPGKICSVVPAVLSNLTSDMVDYINGNPDIKAPVTDMDWPRRVSDDENIFEYGGAILMPDHVLKIKYWYSDIEKKAVARLSILKYECSDGRVFDFMPSVKMRFITLSGQPLIHIAPLHMNVTGPYKSVEIISK